MGVMRNGGTIAIRRALVVALLLIVAATPVTAAATRPMLPTDGRSATNAPTTQPPTIGLAKMGQLGPCHSQ